VNSVRIVLAGKPYDLSVDAAEVAALHRAAEAVNAQVDGFRDRFGVTDRTDQLAMAALQIASELAPDAAETAPQPVLSAELEEALGVLHGRLDRLVADAISRPIALGWGTDPSFRSPMAIAVIGGLLTSTVLSLLVVPVVFTYLDDLGQWSGRMFRKFTQTRSKT
jgi:cell division protein ZapA (FtsZ GTPase activity inhibitor)